MDDDNLLSGILGGNSTSKVRGFARTEGLGCGTGKSIAHSTLHDWDALFNTMYQHWPPCLGQVAVQH